MGHLLGYARVSTTDQQPDLQVDALTAAGCYRVFTETTSGWAVAAIARTLGVSRASIYRNLAEPRS
jgi:transcriptional regulator of acetoin/glycerol metabolism